MAIDSKSKDTQISSLLLRDVDKLVVKWLKDDYPIIVEGRSTPVIFASAERWAQISRDKAIKDEHGQIILPVISVRRLDPEHRKERNYPKVPETEISFYKRIASQSYNKDEGINLNGYQYGVPDSKYLFAKDKPVFEILTLPFPSVVDINYEIEFWTSFLSQQNMELENIFIEFSGGRTFFFQSEEDKNKGYYLFASLKNTTDQSNIGEYTGKERILKTKYSLNITTYLIDKKRVKVRRTIANTKFTLKTN